MKTDHLHHIWAGPDNSRLSSKQISLRLPTHIAAKVAALCEMYPQKNRTQIIADLLTAALDELEQKLPERLGEAVSQNEQAYLAIDDGLEPGEQIYYLVSGPRAEYRERASKHFAALEAELGNSNAPTLYPRLVATEDQLNNRDQ